MVAAEDKCRTTHNLTALSFTTASVAGTLSITTIAMNTLMLYIIFKGNRSRLRSSAVASGALINTVIADLSTGIFTDIIVTASHIIEGLQTSVRREILVAGHIVHFLTTGAALIGVTLLSIDRIIALLFPIYYQNSKVRFKTWHMFLITWATSSLFLISYFQFGFIKHLAVYASINITFPAILMVFTVIAYREKFIKRTLPRIRTKSTCSQVDPIQSSPRNNNEKSKCKNETMHLNVPQFSRRAPASQLKAGGLETEDDRLPWSTYNSLPLQKSATLPRIMNGSSPGELALLQHTNGDLHQSDGALIIPDGDLRSSKKRNRTASVRFLDDNVLTSSLETNRARKNPLRYFSMRAWGSNFFLNGHPGRSSRLKKLSVDAGSDSSVSMASPPAAIQHSTSSKQSSKRRSRTDKRLMRALIINLCVFMLAYTPSISFIIYLNTCANCNCTIVHILRDAVGLFVRSASLLRPLTFLICTKSLKEFLRKLRK